jgi:hypothetical protein
MHIMMVRSPFSIAFICLSCGSSYLAHSKILLCGVAWSSWILLVGMWQSAVYWGVPPHSNPTLLIVSNIHEIAFFEEKRNFNVIVTCIFYWDCRILSKGLHGFVVCFIHFTGHGMCSLPNLFTQE